MRILFICILFLIGCNSKPKQKETESRIVSDIIVNFNKKDSVAILNIKQGAFSYEKITSDSIVLFYSQLGFGLYTGESCKYIDSLERITPTLEAKGYFQQTGFWNTEEIDNITFLEINELKDFLIKDTSLKNNYKIDWEGLNKKGIRILYSFSEPAISKGKNYGMIGMQEYSQKNFDVRILSFEHKDSTLILDTNTLSFEVLGIKVEFRNDSLLSIEPNGLIVK